MGTDDLSRIFEKLDGLGREMEKLNGKHEQTDQLLTDIKKDVEKIDGKLDKTSEQTVGNTKDICYLRENISDIKLACSKETSTIWEEMKKKDSETKKEAIDQAIKGVKLWLYGALITSAGAIVITLIINLIKR